MSDLTIGVVAASRLAAGLVSGSDLVTGAKVWPEGDGVALWNLASMPVDAIVEAMAKLMLAACGGADCRPVAAGIAFPGIVRAGVVEDSPNLRQTKGSKLASLVEAALRVQGLAIQVFLYNDADVTAAGIAAVRGYAAAESWRDGGQVVVRAWTLGTGIGFGRYPYAEGIWEGGHTVVTLDPKEVFCGCGGTGHLEGIMGARAMRLRFMDLEPDEVFAKALEGDARCSAFVAMWHRALAAATASSVHIEGPGRFYITGRNARFIQIALLHRYLHEMVTMSPLQGSVFEVIETNEEIAITGAGLNALTSALAAQKVSENS